MKNKLIAITLFGLLFFSMSSCEKDFLDKGPEEDLTLDEVFANRQYVSSP